MSLQEDYFAMTYCSFMSKYSIKLDLREDEKSQYFMNCVFIFVLQMVLIILLASDLIFGQVNMLKADFAQLLVRFTCAVILHIQVESEVNQAIRMMKYYINHIKSFTRDYKEEESPCKWEEASFMRKSDKAHFYWEPLIIANM